MAEVKLTATTRADTGKGAARRSRAAGKVPAVVYGRGMEPVPVEVDRREFVTALHTDAGMTVLLNIQLDGKSITTLARELQRDPVRGTLLHADFVQVDLKQDVEVEVPVHLVGEASGAKGGGVLEHPLFAVQVRCLPTEVPEAIDADISHLDIGDTLRVADLPRSDAYEILNDPDTVVASVVAPISEEELAAMEAGVTVEGAEAAAAAEGATQEEIDAGAEAGPSVEPDPGAASDEPR